MTDAAIRQSKSGGPMNTATITPDSSVLNLALSQPAVSAKEDRQLEPLSVPLLESETTFYNEYPWSLQVFPKLREVLEHLVSEIRHLPNVQIEWQRQEVSINIFFLSGAILESVDDFLLGKSVDLSKIKDAASFAGPVLNRVESVCAKGRNLRSRTLNRLFAWRTSWERKVTSLVQAMLSEGTVDGAARELQSALSFSFPVKLLGSRPRIPAAFHAQDLTHLDILKLGDKFISRFPDRKRPVSIVGLRTAGTYFALLLQAYFLSHGYEDVSSTTIRPKSGVGYWESLGLTNAARKKSLAIVIDEPGGTGTTYARAVEYLHSAGIVKENIVLLLPVHPTVRDWSEKPGYLRLSRFCILPLEPEEYQKQSLLKLETVRSQLLLYFPNLDYRHVDVLETDRSRRIDARLQSLSEEKSQNRLKKVYEVNLQRENGEQETRFILVKSVGWGWLSYHSFLAGQRLKDFVPPMLGLRRGLLYSEWCGTDNAQHSPVVPVEMAATYIAQRVKSLQLHENPTADLAREGRHFGCEQAVEYLVRAYGGRSVAGLRRIRVRHQFAELSLPCPTFTDGRMQKLEWTSALGSISKSDYEHHGMGKYELSHADPAYDLADFILSFRLSPSDEEALIGQYVNTSGDSDVRRRLFFSKFQAGTWAMTSSLSNLLDKRLTHRHEEYHRRYIDAWKFLTINATQRCGALCDKPQNIEWKAPLVILDVDGVLDRHVFGFPSTTLAGIRAISLLQRHGLTIALDTARSMYEVKEYCRAYGFAGGLAEYGAWAWDAVEGKDKVLIDDQDKEQLDELAQHLRRIPGVFLNDDYVYSLRAFMYTKNGTTSLPTPIIDTLVSDLQLDRIQVRQTSLDTTITARSADKGKGLLALKAMVGCIDAQTYVVGDSDPDIPMFAVSQRSFAPANISRARPIAKALGCTIVEGRYQRGLFQIAQKITHPEGGKCEQCDAPRNEQNLQPPDLFLQLLEVADQGRIARLIGALLDPLSYRAFLT
jgi:hydroxymethylpyrimidine pyrophosphatase-like HAD family hydrolase